MTDVVAPEVRVGNGWLRGRMESGVAVFRGIPFAEPAARFAAPTPAAPWRGTREAFDFGPPPPQSSRFGTDALESADDGWLTANVWTPDPAARLPVLVWIQGGGYVFGTASLPEYDGRRLATDGVVVVTFNYRVGAEGFAQVLGAPANRGLLDQVAALTWVQDNIAAFGGDLARVTVFGQSAGGGCVASLLAMPSAAGLFRRAVVQSMPGTFFTPALAGDVTRALAAEVGAGPDELGSVEPQLLAFAADELLENAHRYADRWGLAAHRQVLLGPVVDGTVLPATPWRALADGVSRDVDLLVGHTRDEQRLFTMVDGLLAQVDARLAERALALFAPAPHGAADYRATGAGPDDLYDRVHSDWLFRMPSLHLAEAHTGTTHLYELAWSAPAMGGLLGACHGLDVPLVFGNLDRGQPAMLLADDLEEAEELSAQMRAAWIGFAATGDPGWPAYTVEDRLTRVVDTSSATVAYPEQDSRQIWTDHVFRELPLAGGEHPR